MIRCAVSGATGRMGKAIIGLMLSDAWSQRISLSGALDHPSCGQLGEDSGIISGAGESKIPVTATIDNALEKANVLIDFTGPDHTMELASYCADKGIAMVIGTTGFNGDQKHNLTSLARVIPILISPNMSVGVNLLFYLTSLSTKLLGDSYDIEVVEAHHRHKKDAPSGTAERLKDIILKETERQEESVVYGRNGLIGERSSREVGIHAVRGGDVVGDHTVFYLGEGERVELTHRASSRNTFASGAIRAAEFLAGKNPGTYSMTDVLGI